MPNQRSQNLTYIDARQAFLLGVDPDQDSRLKNCNWDRDLVARFACAYYFPPCSENGTVLPPCRSLCTGYDFILPLTFCMQCFMYAIHHNIRHEWLQECFIICLNPTVKIVIMVVVVKQKSKQYPTNDTHQLQFIKRHNFKLE